MCSPTDDAGFPVKAEEFVVLSQEPSATEIIAPKIARPFIEVRTDPPGGDPGRALPALWAPSLGPGAPLLPAFFPLQALGLEKQRKGAAERVGPQAHAAQLSSHPCAPQLLCSSQATLPPPGRSRPFGLPVPTVCSPSPSDRCPVCASIKRTPDSGDSAKESINGLVHTF